jgi:hypothetical protein
MANSSGIVHGSQNIKRRFALSVPCQFNIEFLHRKFEEIVLDIFDNTQTQQM